MIKDFTVLFCTISDGKVGSLYFPWGRIRLEHEDGPSIEEIQNPEEVERMTIADAGLARFEAWAFVGDTWEETPEYAALDHAQRVQRLKEFGAISAVAGASNRLVEMIGSSFHASRGYPCVVEISPTEAENLHTKVNHCLEKYSTPEDRNESIVKYIRKYKLADRLGY